MNTNVEQPTAPIVDEARAQVLLTRVVEIYERQLSKTEKPREALTLRNCTDLAALEHCHAGWSDGCLPKMLPSTGEQRGDLMSLGVLNNNGNERLAYCLVFPVYDAEGRIMNLLAYPSRGRLRRLPRPIGLWNLPAAKLAPQLHLTTDVFDALAIRGAGYPSAAALPKNGTVDVRALTTWGTQKIVIVLGESTGKEDAEAIQAACRPLPTTVVRLNGCAGAAEYAKQHGSKALAEAIVAATHGLTAITIPGMQPLPGGLSLTIGPRRYEVRGLENSARRLKATIRAERGGRIHVDTLDLYVARARSSFVRDAARFFEEASDHIETDMNRLLLACEARAAQPDIAAALAPVDPVPEADRREAEAMGRDVKLVQTIIDDLDQLGVVGEPVNKLLSYVVMTSRKLTKPIPQMTLSSSGSGKSTVQDAVCRLCPPEDLVKITSLSGRALHYKESGSLRHKLLAIEETEGVQRAAYALRTLISSGELTTEVAVKDPASGRLTTMTNKVRGPVAVMLTTTSTDIDAETRSRFCVTHVDESPEQTRAINERQRRDHTLEGIAAAHGTDAVIRRHHAFQRLLQPLRVVNPLIERIGQFDGRLPARREQPKVLCIVEAVALLRQLQKQVKQVGDVPYIEVDETDIGIAADLCRHLFVRSQELSHPGHELLAVLGRMRKAAGVSTVGGDPEVPFAFTRRQVREFAGWSAARVHRYLRELIELEFALRAGGRRGMPDRYVLQWNGEETQTPTLFPFEVGCSTGDSGVFYPAQTAATASTQKA